MSLSVEVEEDPFRERIEDWIGLQSVEFWEKGKEYKYDPNECKTFKSEAECEEKQKVCVWDTTECKATNPEKKQWNLGNGTPINSVMSGRAFKLVASICIASDIRFTEEPDLPCNDFFCKVFCSLRGKNYVILLPSGTLGDVEKRSKDAWEDEKAFNRVTNEVFTDEMVEAVIANEFLKKMPKNAKITVAGHSMGAVLAQKLCKKASEKEFLPKFTDLFFTGSGAYLWGFPQNKLDQEWFTNEEDPFTKTVGTGHGEVEGLTFEEMKEKVEKGEMSISAHNWTTYADIIKKRLKPSI